MGRGGSGTPPRPVLPHSAAGLHRVPKPLPSTGPSCHCVASDGDTLAFCRHAPGADGVCGELEMAGVCSGHCGTWLHHPIMLLPGGARP